MKRIVILPLLLIAAMIFAACAEPVFVAEQPVVVTEQVVTSGESPSAEPAEEAAPTEEPVTEAEPTEEPMAEEETMMDIVEVAMSNPDFSTLVTAVSEAGLVEALQGDGPFTVFAPTNAAFDALPEGTLDTLLADPSGDLTQILLYHVVPGKVMAADVSDGLEAETLQGSPVSFSVDGDSVMINEANIVATDIEASNGVIHVIDAVILPPAE